MPLLILLETYQQRLLGKRGSRRRHGRGEQETGHLAGIAQIVEIAAAAAAVAN